MDKEEQYYKEIAESLREIAGKDLVMLQEYMEKAQRGMQPELISFLSDFAVKNFSGFFSGGLNISLVIDSNSLINCLHNKFFKEQDTILIPISQNPLVTIYYSDYIKKETFRKVREGKIKKKHRETPSVAEVLQYAEYLFSYFTLVPDDAVFSHPLADKLEKRDPKDVPILNLVFSKNTHGILTGDKDFEDFDHKSWKISDFGDTVGTLNKGVLSLAFSTFVGSVIIHFFKLLFLIFMELCRFALRVLKAGAKLIQKNPLLTIFLVAGAGLLNESVRKKTGNSPIRELLVIASESAKKLFQNLSNLMQEAERSQSVQTLRPIAAYIVSLTYDLLQASEDLDRLRENKPEEDR